MIFFKFLKALTYMEYVLYKCTKKETGKLSIYTVHFNNKREWILSCLVNNKCKHIYNLLAAGPH